MTDHTITDVAALEAIYGAPRGASITKEVDRLLPVYRTFVEAAPFCALATSGPEGLDVSPRGDAPGFVTVEDDKTLYLPDRAGNNRVDSLRNVVRDPRIALLFLIPGIGETFRINGTAKVSIDPALLERFAIDGKKPRSVLKIAIESVFFQCSRAIVRSDLWNPEKHRDRTSLPTAGQILQAVSQEAFDGAAYDAALPKRVAETLY
jgi:PPOX class probable FMN-dependent enzyme